MKIAENPKPLLTSTVRWFANLPLRDYDVNNFHIIYTIFPERIGTVSLSAARGLRITLAYQTRSFGLRPDWRQRIETLFRSRGDFLVPSIRSRRLSSLPLSPPLSLFSFSLSVHPPLCGLHREKRRSPTPGHRELPTERDCTAVDHLYLHLHDVPLHPERLPESAAW